MCVVCACAECRRHGSIIECIWAGLGALPGCLTSDKYYHILRWFPIRKSSSCQMHPYFIRWRRMFYAIRKSHSVRARNVARVIVIGLQLYYGSVYYTDNKYTTTQTIWKCSAAISPECLWLSFAFTLKGPSTHDGNYTSSIFVHFTTEAHIFRPLFLMEILPMKMLPRCCWYCVRFVSLSPGAICN